MDRSLESFVGPDPIAFRDLLSRLQSAHTGHRTEAESIFRTLKEHRADGLVSKLLEALKTNQSAEARIFSTTLLRQLLTKDHPSLWTNLSKPQQEMVKIELLRSLSTEPENDVSQKMADLTAELFSKIIGEDYWPELMPFVLGGIESKSPRLTLSCLHILAELAPVLVDSMENSVEKFLALITNCLAMEELQIKLATLRSLQAFALCLQEVEEVRKLKVVMQQVMVAFQALQSQPMESLEAHAIMIELAGYVPSLFEDTLDQMLAEFLARARNPSLDVDSKTMALEFILTLIEGSSRSQIGNLQHLVEEFISILMECLLQIEDVEDWYVRTGGAQDCPDFGDVHDLGVASVDRLASSIPGTLFLSLFLPYLDQWSRDEDWKKRHGVLTVIGQMAEGCSKEIQDSVGPLLNICSAGLLDSHLRVRWAACQALGLVADEVGGLFERDHRDEVIRRLMQAAIVDHPSATSVQEHALRCLLNIIQNSEHPFTGLILEEVIKWILQSLHFEHQGVSKVATDCLSCMASVMEPGQFGKYYDEAMKAVFGVLARYKDPAHLIEMSEVLEVMTMVGEAAGQDSFKKEFQFLVDFLCQLIVESKKMEDLDDKRNVLINVLNSFGHISNTLKAEFSSLDLLKPILLEALNTEPKFEKLNPEDLEDMEEEDLPLVIGDMAFSTDRMSLAFLTCGMKNAMSIAENLDHEFFPLLVPTLERFLIALDYTLNKEVRELGIQGQPILLKCAISMLQKEDNEEIRSFISTMLTKQWEALLGLIGDLTEDAQKSLIPSVFEAVGKIIEVLKSEIEPSMLQAVFIKVEKAFQQLEVWRNEQQTSASEGPGDDLEDTTEEEEEENLEKEILSSIETLFAGLLKTSGDQYYDWIEAFFPALQKLLVSLKDEEETDHGMMEVILTIMTDICEFSVKGRETHGTEICQLFLQKLDHPYLKVKHTSAFGLGLLMQTSPQAFQPMMPSVLEKLAKQLEEMSEKKFNSDLGMAKDNFVSAIWKILAVKPENYTMEVILLLYRLCMNHLPLRYDLDEAFFIHEALLRYLEAKDEYILGRGKENVSQCLGILMEILASDVQLASTEILRRSSVLLKRMEHEKECGTIAMKKLQEWSVEQQKQFNAQMSTN